MRRVLDHDHGGAVNKLVLNLEIRELVLVDLINDSTPESACRQHVCLVERDNPRIAPFPGQDTAQARDTLDLWFRVNGGVERVGSVILLSLSEIQARGQLADDNHVGAAADGRLQGGGLDKGVGREEAGTEVAVGAHLTAQLQETLLRADGAGAPFGATDGAEKHGIGGFGGSEGLVGEGGAGLVDGALGRNAEVSNKFLAWMFFGPV